MKNKPIALLNCAILTADGKYILTPITLVNVRTMIMVNGNNVNSYIGHESTAQILTELLEQDVEVNRTEFKHETGQIAIVFKLKKRGSEGKIYTKKEIEDIGYEFKMLEKKE